MFDINGWEFVIIAVIAVLLIGPERLPQYAAKLRSWIRELRSLAEGAKEQLREQMGPEFDEVDWKAYDPRQYDPRRIVREALLEDPKPAGAGSEAMAGSAGLAGLAGMGGAATAAATGAGPTAQDFAPPPPAVYDPGRPTPYDDDAT